MKKIEIVKKFKSPREEIAVIIKYPRILKFFIKFIDFYVVPDLEDIRIKDKEYESFCERYKELICKPPKPPFNISDIT